MEDLVFKVWRIMEETKKELTLNPSTDYDPMDPEPDGSVPEGEW